VGAAAVIPVAAGRETQHSARRHARTAAIPDQLSAAPEEREVAIVGAGFGGLCMAIRLLAQGERRLAILEKGTEVDGTCRTGRGSAARYRALRRQGVSFGAVGA